jgi:hypothetical protein
MAVIVLIAFMGLVLCFLTLDPGVFHRRPRPFFAVEFVTTGALAGKGESTLRTGESHFWAGEATLRGESHRRKA